MADNINGLTYSANTPVSKPIVLTSVARLLGTNIKDVTRLCTSDNINKWAKYKPVQSSVLFPANDAYLKEHALDLAQLYGLQIDGIGVNPSNNEAIDLYNFNLNENYEYCKPKQNEPKRLGDFYRYLHNAQPMLQMQYFETTLGGTSGTTVFEGEDNVYVGSTTTEMPEYLTYYALCTTSQYSVNINDIADYLGNNSSDNAHDHIALVAHIYTRDKSTWIGSYFGDGIRLWYPGEEKTSISDFEFCDNYNIDGNSTCRWFWVKFKLDKATYWGDTSYNNKFYAVITISRVKYSGGKWIEENRLAIPYDLDHYFGKNITINIINRVLSVAGFYSGTDSNVQGWTTRYETVWLANIQSPRFNFRITKVPDEAITFGSASGQYAIVATHDYVDSTGSKHSKVVGKLIKEDGSDLSSLTIPKASSTNDVNNAVLFYYSFNGLLSYVQNRDTQRGSYNITFYLVKLTSNFNVNTYSLKSSEIIGTTTIILK